MGCCSSSKQIKSPNTQKTETGRQKHQKILVDVKELERKLFKQNDTTIMRNAESSLTFHVKLSINQDNKQYIIKKFELKDKIQRHQMFFKVLDFEHTNIMKHDIYYKNVIQKSLNQQQKNDTYYVNMIYMELAESINDRMMYAKKGIEPKIGQIKLHLTELISALKEVNQRFNKSHLNIKPTNILIIKDKNQKETYKLCDFGFQGQILKQLKENKYIQKENSEYICPELKYYVQSPTIYINFEKCDVYALGKVFAKYIDALQKKYLEPFETQSQLRKQKEDLQKGTEYKKLEEIFKHMTKEEKSDRVDLKDCQRLCKGKSIKPRNENDQNEVNQYINKEEIKQQEYQKVDLKKDSFLEYKDSDNFSESGENRGVSQMHVSQINQCDNSRKRINKKIAITNNQQQGDQKKIETGLFSMNQTLHSSQVLMDIPDNSIQNNQVNTISNKNQPTKRYNDWNQPKSKDDQQSSQISSNSEKNSYQKQNRKENNFQNNEKEQKGMFDSCNISQESNDNKDMEENTMAISMNVSVHLENRMNRN